MKIIPTDVPDVLVIEPLVHHDPRGFFLETWQAPRYHEAGLDAHFVQDNHSRSVRGTLRGLHYQVEQPQGKLISVVRGEVYDVAVDLRQGSPTFGRWTAQRLSDENHRQLWIPPGCAHGFYVLSDVADVVYKCTQVYASRHERVVRWDDLDLAIRWPLLDSAPPLLSAKDAAAPALRDAPAHR